MKVLITGANGLLGQKLVPLLVNDPDFTVVATSRGENRMEIAENLTYVSFDLLSEGDIEHQIDSIKPDCIIHTAAMTNVDQCELEKEACYQINVEAVRHLVKAAEKIQAFFIHLSTDFIFDGKEGPLDEDAEAEPVNYYGETKLIAEKIIRESRLRWAIARTVLVYGITNEMSRSNIILWVKNSLEKGEKIRVVNDQWRTPTLAEDLAMGCYLIAKKQAAGIFNISGSDFLTPYAMAMKVADYFNLDKSLIEETDSTIFKQPARRPMITGFNIQKAREELGYTPHSFEEGIQIVARQTEARKS